MPQSFNNNLRSIVRKYIRLLNVNVTVTSAEKDIEENPYYPSLLSLSDTFDKYQIKNNAFEVAPEDFNYLHPPFIAYIQLPTTAKDFIIITKITNEKVSYLSKNKNPTIILKEEFLKLYQGIVWIAEPNENSGEIEFKTKREQEQKSKYKRTVWIGGAIALILLAIIVNMMTALSLATYFSILLIKFVGMAAAVLLLVYEIDKSNAFVKNICTAGKQTNCDAVLSSKASKIIGISWAEIGFFYFASTILWLLFPSLSFFDKISCLAIANAFATPYILFSIYYQWKVIKQWCPLCLTVQLVLFSEFIWSFNNFWNSGFRMHLSTNYLFSWKILSMVFCILFPIIIWYGTKPFFKRFKDANLYVAAYKRLQNNPAIFKSLLQEQEKVADGWQHLGINIGNLNAENTIIKVCNPYCKPCAIMHPVLEEIINNNEKVRLKIIFKTFDNLQGKDAIIIKHLLTIAAQNNTISTQHALDNWYLAEQKNYEAFAGKYQMNGRLEEQNSKLEAMSNWCKEAEIPYTPTIFINGYRLPEDYDVKELKYIL